MLSQTESKWTFAADGVHLGIGVESEWARSQDQNQIVLKLRDSIRLFLANELNKPLRLPRLQTYQLISQRGNPLEVRERTPNDTLRLKCPLASYTVAGTNSLYHIYNVTLGSELDAAKLFRVPDGTITREVNDLRPFAGQTSVPDATKLGDKMWRHDPDEGLKLVMPQKYRDYFYSDSWPAISGVSVQETIKSLRSLSRGSGCDASADAIPLDDMLLRWTRLDRQLGVRLSSVRGIVYPKLMLASDSDVSLDEKVALTDALADLGESLIPFYVDPKESTHWRVCEAVLLARYRRPWTEDHLAACKQLLPAMKEFSAGEFAIVKTLILMDEIASVPALQVARWYKRHVIHGTTFEQRDGLRQLTLTPKGREWLRRHLSEDDTDPSEAGTLGRKVLRQRAEATLTTKQWDFMSEVECQETMAFLKALPPLKPRSSGIQE